MRAVLFEAEERGYGFLLFQHNQPSWPHYLEREIRSCFHFTGRLRTTGTKASEISRLIVNGDNEKKTTSVLRPSLSGVTSFQRMIHLRLNMWLSGVVAPPLDHSRRRVWPHSSWKGFHPRGVSASRYAKQSDQSMHPHVWTFPLLPWKSFHSDW